MHACKRTSRELVREIMTEVVEEGAAADSVTVSIVLVPKDEAAHLNKKLKRTPQSDSEAVHMDKDKDKMVFMESSKLRKCSRYFATCMSGRWETDMVFHLELQTEARYYHDCFARMKSPFLNPITSITHGIQLFKVASQIEYHALMDICERYLAAAPWSTDEEDELRALCAMGDLPSDSDLVSRLRFPLTKKARQVETQSLIQRTISRYLRSALALDWRYLDFHGPECLEGNLDFRDVFTEAFHLLCKESSSKMGHDALIDALGAFKTELENTLLSMESLGRKLDEVGYGEIVNRTVFEGIGDGMVRYVWMFQLLREANAAQVAVELLMKHKVSNLLRNAVTTMGITSSGAGQEWAKMIYCMFQDILGGRLFLKSSERMTLFLTWNWVLQIIDHMAPGEPPVSELVVSLIMSFPQLQQEEIFLNWEQNDDHYALPNAHATWITSMLRPDNVPNHEKTSSAMTVVEDKVDLPKGAGRSGGDM